ncbi:MAG: Mur ligase family protein [Bacteroidetes bacterium]|nr:Mur ligase family protein [Bacteroidota bacterium]
MAIEKLYQIYLKFPTICTDTRKISTGCLYWALRGSSFDGNSFIPNALELGAAFCITDDEKYRENPNCFYVEDSLKALQKLANHHRRNLSLPIIAIAGSNGKTTTKELTALVLAQKLKTFATPGNFNNHIGLPLSLLMLNKTHEIAVIELGANHQGENAFLCQICEPDFGIVTNIGKDHLEGFGGMEGVEKANAELFDSLRENVGIAFVNADDEAVVRNTEELEKVTYSAHSDADFTGSIKAKFPFITAVVRGETSPKSSPKERTLSTGVASELFPFSFGEGVRRTDEVIISSHLFGSFHLYNILAALAIGRYFGVSLADCKKAIESYIPANNRSQVLEVGTNTFIMDAYNANPSSMQGALQDFMQYPAENRILVLGEMLEMGDESFAEHQQIIEMINPNLFKEIVLVGKEFLKHQPQLKANYFKDIDEARTWYKTQNWQNAVVYMKGSRGCKLERLLE